MPIFEQLQLEEALLRTDDREWCLINFGSPEAIVMGISGKPEELVALDHLEANPIPLIRRFSGGGTVVVDHQTLFITFIGNGTDNFPCNIHQSVLKHYSFAPFTLRENDYVIGDRKVGGNAQYLRKERWLHHTTFLWDYRPDNMRYLSLPKKRPNYRQDRHHTDFLTTLAPHFPSLAAFHSALKEQLSLYFQPSPTPFPIDILNRPHRKSTAYVEKPNVIIA
ncbi:MAG: lipoate--protein ligase family protein [Chlamydiia bacterium]|nr:lipoate--protein ligase family protein [Chlamydiia bacterium]